MLSDIPSGYPGELELIHGTIDHVTWPQPFDFLLIAGMSSVSAALSFLSRSFVRDSLLSELNGFDA